MMRYMLLILSVFLGLLCSPSGGETRSPGRGHLTAELRGIRLSVFTYHPGGCDPRGVLLVFHGQNRNAANYRDHARGSPAELA